MLSLKQMEWSGIWWLKRIENMHRFRFDAVAIVVTNAIASFYMTAAMPRVNTLRPRQNGCHFAGDIFKCIFLNENAWISLKISLKFVPTVRINNIPALVQIMAWRRPSDKPLSEPMMVSLLTHICVTRPQWVKKIATASHRYRDVRP